MEFTGTLVYGEVRGVEDVRLLDDSDRVLAAMCRACAAGGATVVQSWATNYHPTGLTAVAVLAESHAVVHTYPEHAAYMMDVFTCGTAARPMAIARAIMMSLGGGTPQLREVRRGDAWPAPDDRQN